MGALRVGLGAVLVAALGAVVPVQTQDPAAGATQDTVTVMTRNTFWGGDWQPLFDTSSMSQVVRRATTAYMHSRTTRFPIRARAMAQEVQQHRPALIGLQEVTLWRSGPPNTDPSAIAHPGAEHVERDHLRILLHRINSGPVRYAVAVVQDNVDFEVPVNSDGDPATGPLGADKNIRFTQRNVILARQDVTWSMPTTQHFSQPNLMTMNLAGDVELTWRRGWASVRAQLPAGPWITFGVAHLESFDSRLERPSVRARQAAEVAAGMRALPTPGLLVGDFNSGLPARAPGSEQAFTSLVGAGLRHVDGDQPTCCLRSSPDLHHGGSAAEFDHAVDHIFTTSPERVTLISSRVTGRHKSFGYWPGDHAGVVSRIRLRQPS